MPRLPCRTLFGLTFAYGCACFSRLVILNQRIQREEPAVQIHG